MTELQIHPCHPNSGVVHEDVQHPSPFLCEIKVDNKQSSSEVDHVNNIQYIRWIDRGSQLHCDACGWTRSRLLDDGVMWFVARHEIDYLAEVKAGDTLQLTTWVDDVRRVKSWRSTVIHTTSDPIRAVCKCRTLWVLVDLNTRRPTAIPKDMAMAFDSRTKPRLAST